MLRLNADRRRLQHVSLRRFPSVCGIGVDCEEIKRFKDMNRNLMDKIFTKDEIAYCSRKAKPEQHLAARFAGKEAVMKCFGSMGKRILLNQIEILNRKNGSPCVRIVDKSLKAYDVKISLSHSKEIAMAFAVASEIRGGENG